MKIFEKKKLPGLRRQYLLFGIPILSYRKRKGRFESMNGCGNTVVNRPEKCRITVWGDRNRIVFPEHCEGFIGSIQIGAPDFHINDCIVEFGNGIQVNGMSITLMEDGTRVTFGNDCLVSSGVQLWASDTHAILDASGNPVNIGDHITIGNHVWIGIDAKLMKNTTVPDNCIVAAGAVVVGHMNITSGSIVAGNPAKVVRTGVRWSKSRPGALLRDRQDVEVKA